MARKQKHTQVIYGKTFTFVKGDTTPYYRCDTIYDAYDKPSATKREIWEDWQRWKCLVSCDANHIEMWVSGYNSSFFSIGGFITTPYGEKYGYYITATRQEIWLISKQAI